MSAWKLLVAITVLFLFIPFSSAQFVESGFGSDYVQGNCGGDLPQICKDNGFQINKAMQGYAEGGVGVGQVLCTLPNGDLSYQYGCSIDTTALPDTRPIIDQRGSVIDIGFENQNHPSNYILFNISSIQRFTSIAPYVFTKSIPPHYSPVVISSGDNGLVSISLGDVFDRTGNIISGVCQTLDNFLSLPKNLYSANFQAAELFNTDVATAAKIGLSKSLQSCTAIFGEKLKFSVAVYQTPLNAHLYPGCLSPFQTDWQKWLERKDRCQPDHGLRPVVGNDPINGTTCGFLPMNPSYSPWASPSHFCEVFGMKFSGKADDLIDGRVDWWLPTLLQSVKKVVPPATISMYSRLMSSCGYYTNPSLYSQATRPNATFGSQIPFAPCGGGGLFDLIYQPAANITCELPINFTDPDYSGIKTGNVPWTRYPSTVNYQGKPFQISNQDLCMQDSVGPYFVHTDSYTTNYIASNGEKPEFSFYRPHISIKITDENGNPLPSKYKNFSHSQAPQSISNIFTNKTTTHYSVSVGQRILITTIVEELQNQSVSTFFYSFPGLGGRHITTPGPTSLAWCDYSNSAGCLEGDVYLSNGTVYSGQLHITQTPSIKSFAGNPATGITFAYTIPPEYRDYLFNPIPLSVGDSYQIFFNAVDEFRSASDVAIFFDITAPVCDNNNIDPANGETDVDCGGSSCGQCGLSDRCELDSDCQSGFCFIDPSVPLVQTGTTTSSGKTRTGSGYGQGICRIPSGGTQAQIQCQENWVTSPWSACVGGTQTRIITDTNNCNNPIPIITKPDEQRSCVNLAACVPNPTTNVCGGTSNGCSITSYNNGLSCGSNNTGVCFGGNCYVGAVSQSTCWTADWTDCELHNINGQKGFYKIRNKNPQKLAGSICATIPASDRAGAVQKCSLSAAQASSCQQSLITSGFDPKLSTDFDSVSSLSSVAGFKIGNQYAHVQYIDPVDISSISCQNLGSIFRFGLNNAFVDTENNTQLNKQALLTFFTQGIKDPALKDDKGKCVNAFVVRWDESTGIFTSRVPHLSGYSVVEGSECSQSIPLSVLLLLILIPAGAIAWFLFYTYYKKDGEGKTLWQDYLARRSEIKSV